MTENVTTDVVLEEVAQSLFWMAEAAMVAGEKERENILHRAAMIVAALLPHSSDRDAVIEVVQLQPDDDSPGLWIGFKTSTDRAKIMTLLSTERGGT